jgi:hypothetical protein
MVASARTDVDTVSGEVLPANVRDSAASPRTLGKFDQFLKDRNARDGDPEVDPYERILQQVLSAKTPDAVLTPVEVMQGRDIIGVPFILADFTLNESDFDEGSPFYANMTCHMPPEGEPVPVNCGHKKVLAQLVKLKEMDAFPIAVKFITRGTAKVGGTPMLELTKWGPEDGESGL